MTARGEEGAKSSTSEPPQGGSGRYRVFATLGRGGMAEVFLAIAIGPRDFNKLVVLKRLRPHLAEEPSFREMFLDEARLAARLNHPNVVQSYEVGEENGVYFIAMEYLDGQPLDRLLQAFRKRKERIDPALAARIVADACSGLVHAHELKDYDGAPLRIIHRDVSPQNIFVSYDGQVKVVDFGIAKAAVSRARTEDGVLKGKIAYMAPEQAAGEPIDARADLFAMGAVLWELVAGRALFEGDNAVHILHDLMRAPIPTPSSVLEAKEPGGKGVDPDLEAIVMRALEKDPGERFPSARAMREALEGWIQASRRTARRDDVGDLVSGLFSQNREEVQREIRKHMDAVRSPSTAPAGVSFSSIDRIDPTGAGSRRRLIDLGSESTLAASGLSRSGDPSAASRTLVAPTAKRRTAAYALPLLLLAGAGAFFALRPAPPRAALPVASVSLPTAEPVHVSTGSPQASLGPAPPPLAASPPAASSVATHHPAHAPSSAPPKPAPETPAAPGFLTLDTYPWTNVSENGRVLGTTPLVHVALAPGTHVLTLDNTELGIHKTYEATIASGATFTRSLGVR